MAAMERSLDRAVGLLWCLTTPAMLFGLWMAFLYAPEEKIMGAAQRIFYFHVPAAIVTFLGVALMLAGSIAYLWTRKALWDDFSVAATETTLLFCTLVIVTGPIWAKPAWGVWWTWEARLTTTLILWLLLIGALMVRHWAADRETGGRLAAIVGIFAAVDVPIIHKAVEWWRGQHPQVFAPNNPDSLHPKMAQAFGVCALVFVALFMLILLTRWRLALTEQRLAQLVENRVDDAYAR